MELAVLEPCSDGRKPRCLRDKKLRRVQQKAIINSERAANRRSDAQAQAHCIRPVGAQIKTPDALRLIQELLFGTLAPEQLAGKAKDVAAIVKGNYLEAVDKGDARF